MEKKDMTAVIARCLNGDSLAQEELVLAVQNRVYYHCKKMLKDEDRAFDLTQDVLIAMLTKLDTLQNPEVFWSWLGSITANLCRNALSRGPREMQIPEDEEGNSLLDTYETLDEQEVPDKALDNDETRRMIAELVDDLPDAQRQCVLLYYYDEMSVKDIAASLEVSENTVKSRLNYARKSIKEGVERYEKQGIKLYGLSPLPFLLFFLGRDAKACGMTAEQAAQVARQVLQNASAAAVGTGAAAAANAAAGGSAASAAGGSAVAAAAKTAAAAAGKGLFGLSAKAIAGTLAGLVLAGGITGGILLGGEKDANKAPADTDQISVSTDETPVDTEEVPVDTEEVPADISQTTEENGWTAMAYAALPEWVDVPFDLLDNYFDWNCTTEVHEVSSSPFGGEKIRTCLYSSQSGENLFFTRATMEDDRITYVIVNHSVSQPIGWLDITMGDSYESVMAKLDLQDVPSECNSVICHFYASAPDKSEYITHTQPQFGREISLNYQFVPGNTDCYAWINLLFIDDQLSEFSYCWDASSDVQLPTEEDEQSDGGSGGGMVISNISDTSIEVSGREQGYDDGWIGGGDQYTTTISYVEFPGWADVPYEEIGRYFLVDPRFSEYQPRVQLVDGVPKLCAWRPPDDTMCLLLSPVNIEFTDGSMEILTLYVSNATYEEIPISVGWLDVFTGDSFESVLGKLGLHDFPVNTERVEVYFDQNADADGTCNYYTTSDDTSAPPYQEIALYYGDIPVCFLFDEGTLSLFAYGYCPG